MAIKNNTKDLKNIIIQKLKKAKITLPDIDKDTGKLNDNGKDVDFISSSIDGKIVKFKGASKPKYGENYTSSKETGIEKIAEAIANEVLSYIVEHAEVNLKERLDTLESDFNALLISLQGSGAGMTVTPLTPVGSALNAAAMAGGTAGRNELTTIPLKTRNEKTDIG